MPSLSRSVNVTWAGCGMLARIVRPLPGLSGWPMKTTPWRMSVPRMSSRPLPSTSTRWMFETAGVFGMSGIDSVCRTNWMGDSAGSGQGSGAASRSGARAT